ALLRQASMLGLRGQFSEVGWISLYRAALGVAAERPELFVGQSERPTEQIASDLLTNVATSLHEAPPPFDGDVGADLAVAVLNTVRTEGPRFLDPNGPWERGVAALGAQVAEGLATAVRDPQTQTPRSPLSRQQLVRLAHIFIEQAARTPATLAGNRSELR